MFEPDKITKDGHKVRSRGEVIIDNLLYDLGIKHEYEIYLKLGKERVSPDFYLPLLDKFIEFWGLTDDPDYQQRKNKKISLYKSHDVEFLSLYAQDVDDHQKLMKKIQNFVDIESKPERYEIDITDFRKGVYCLFCLAKKTPSREKPLCRKCWELHSKGIICILCGEDKFSGYDYCKKCYYGEIEACKICTTEIDSQKGKSLCYGCYAQISVLSPKLPTPKWKRKKKRRNYDY